MKIVIVTTLSDPFSQLFWKSYFNSEGPSLEAIFFLPEKDSNYSFFKKILMSLFLFGFKGTLCLARLKFNYNLLKKKGCRFYHFQSINKESAINVLKKIEPDIIVSVGAPQIFKKEILQIPKLGVLNIHNGLLPKYRGHFGTFWEVFHNEKRAYISIHKIEEKVDCGEILDFDYLEIKKSVNLLDLLIDKKIRGGNLLAKVLRGVQKQGIIFKTKEIIKEKNNLKNYFPWPSFKDILKFRLQLFKFKAIIKLF